MEKARALKCELDSGSAGGCCRAASPRSRRCPGVVPALSRRSRPLPRRESLLSSQQAGAERWKPLPRGKVACLQEKGEFSLAFFFFEK